MKKALCALAVFTLLFTTACGNPKLKNGEEAVAEVNGKKYTADELYKELKGQYGYSVLIDWVDKQIAEAEVETTDKIKAEVDQYVQLYIQYAESYGMSIGDFCNSYLGISGITDEEGLREFITSQTKLTEAIQKQVKAKLTKKEIEDYYNDNYKTVYTYREIYIASYDDADDTVSKVKKEIKDKSGDKLVETFSSLAKEYSDGETASNGGLVERAIKTKVDKDVWSKLKDLSNGKATSNAIETDDGFYFILRISKDDADDLEDVKDEIKDALVNEKLNNDPTLGYDTLTELRNKYKMAFYDSDLKQGYKSYLEDLEKYKKQLEEANE